MIYSDIPKEFELTPPERQELPERAQQYIAALEHSLQEYKHALTSQEGELRRKRHAYWDRSRY